MTNQTFIHNTMKKHLFIAMTAVMTLVSCNNQTPAVDDKTSAAQENSGVRIAYVEVDSIMTQYKFCTESSAVLEKKAQNIENTINQKAQALQSAINKFQSDYQNNRITSQAEGEQRQAAIQKQQSDLQALQQRLSADFQTETEKFNEALRDSIQNYIALYNKDKKYSLILTKQGDNILYADKALDITDDVIAGLNKAYKGAPAPAKTEGKK